MIIYLEDYRKKKFNPLCYSVSWVARFIAFVLDMSLCAIMYWVILKAIYTQCPNLICPACPWLLFIGVYGLYFERDSRSSTPGKGVIGLKCVTQAGDSITLKVAWFRAGIVLLCGLSGGFLFMIGQSILGNRLLHDAITQTYVIKRGE